LFKQYLERQKAPKAVNLYALAQQLSPDPSPFLSDLRSRAFTTPKSTKIVPFPHPTGGLTYTHPTQLQTHLLYPPAPGRILFQRQQPHQRGNDEAPYMLAGVGGTLAKVLVSDSMGKVPVQWESLETESGRKEAEGSAAKFRVSSFNLTYPPTVAKGHTPLSGVKGVKMEVSVRAQFETDPWTVLNSHRLGTSEHIAHENKGGSRSVKSLTGWSGTAAPRAATSRYARPSGAGGAQNVLNTLEDLLPKV